MNTAKKTTKKTKTSDRPYKTALVLPDLHVPRHDPRTLAAVEAYMPTQRWDWLIYLGDFLNLDCISRHVTDDLVAQTAETIESEAVAGRAILKRHVGLVRAKNPDCRVVLLEGNHDFRIKPYVLKNPQIRGLRGLDDLLDTRLLGVEWVPSWSENKTYKIGNATFHHGLYTNMHHAKKTAQVFGTPIWYGHTHDIQSHSEILYGHDKTIMAQSCGCLCLYDQEYLRGRPTRWQQAFCVFKFFDDGYFQPEIVPIFKHRFVGPILINSMVYDGRT